jgi:hypothetical protein
LTNQEQGGAFTAITNSIKDGYLGVPAVDRVKENYDLKLSRDAAADKVAAPVLAAVAATQNAGVSQKTDLQAYTGIYHDNWLGDVIIAVKDGKLMFNAKRSPKLAGEMRFYKGNTFVVRWLDRGLNADAFASFVMGVDGAPAGLTMKAISPETDFSYDFHDLDLKFMKR